MEYKISSQIVSIDECGCVTVLKQRIAVILTFAVRKQTKLKKKTTNGGERRTGLGDRKQRPVQIILLHESVDVVQFLQSKITFHKLCFQSFSDKRSTLCSLDIVTCGVHHDSRQMFGLP